MSSVHRGDDPRILTKECLTLAASGFEVSLITPEPWIDPPSGITHTTVPRQTGRLARLLRTIPAVYRAARAERAQVYHLHDPELLGVGVLLRARGSAVVYDAHEDVANQVRHKPWVPSLLKGIVGRLAGIVERSLANRMSAVVAATDRIAALHRPDRTIVVRNFARLEEFGHAEASTPYATREPLVAYVGNVSVPRGAREMVAAVELVDPSLHARLRIAGEFSPPSLHAELERLPGWSRVDALGWQDRRGVSALLASARIGIVCLHPTPSYLESYPVKLFEYMAAGIPVVASDFPLWRMIVAGAGCGVLVDPRDARQIAGAIEQLLRNPSDAEEMGRRGRAAVEGQWGWEPEGRRLVRLYRGLTDRIA